MDSSEKTLIEAVEKYNTAINIFEDLNSAVKTQNKLVSNLLNKESAEFKMFEEGARAAQKTGLASFGALTYLHNCRFCPTRRGPSLYYWWAFRWARWRWRHCNHGRGLACKQSSSMGEFQNKYWTNASKWN